MRQAFLLLLLGILSVLKIEAQNLESEMLYPDTLRSNIDSFYVSSPRWETPLSYHISKDDTLNLGTYGYKGVRFSIWTDIDTIVIPHVNYPFRQLIKIPIASNRDTALCILRFQAVGANFSDSYVEKASGEYVIDLPEMYELANIILFLSKCSELTGNQPETDYANSVKKHFRKYGSHKLIQVLSNNCSNEALWSVYYGFRENSLCFGFDKEGNIQYNQPYKSVRWDNSGLYGGQFRNMLYLIQDFVEKSNFRAFYRENLYYYSNLIKREYELFPINDMWTWLEAAFPQRFDSYKIIFSPLITGSHSTQKFQKGLLLTPSFKECIMFINSSEQVDGLEISEKLKEGLRSGIVFTEIDHNYVNPTSKKHINAIKELIRDKGFWASKKAQQNYSSEYLIFNEYMTHALFCLYVQEKYDSKTGKDIIERRIQLMKRRGFLQFEAFNSILLAMMGENPKTVYESYADIIAEMNKIK
jgi:hypothetical protein